MVFKFTSNNINDYDTTGNQYFGFLIDNDTFPNGKYLFRNRISTFEVNYVAGAQTLAEQLLAIPYVASNYVVYSFESVSFSSFQISYTSDNANYEIIDFEHPTFVNYRDNGSNFPQRWTFFRFKTTVSKRNSDGSITELGTDYITPDADGVGTINIADYFKHEVKTALDISTGIVAREQQNMLAAYYITVEETSTDTRFNAMEDETKVPATSTDRFAMWGGVGYIKQAIYNQTTSNWFQDYLGKAIKPFLSYFSGEKIITETQRERLFFLNIAETVLNLKCKITYENDTQANIVAATVSGAKAYTIYAFHIGINNDLGLGNTTSKVAKIEVWLENATTVISVSRSYTIDRNYAIETRYIYYVNSLGAWETIRLNQSITDTHAISRTLISYVIADNYDLAAHAIRTESTRQQRTEASVGWLSKQQKQLIAEMLTSKKAFEDKGFGVPIIINFTNEETADNNREFLKTETISYTRAFEEQYYSDEETTAVLGSGYFDEYFDAFFN